MSWLRRIAIPACMALSLVACGTQDGNKEPGDQQWSDWRDKEEGGIIMLQLYPSFAVAGALDGIALAQLMKDVEPAKAVIPLPYHQPLDECFGYKSESERDEITYDFDVATAAAPARAGDWMDMASPAEAFKLQLSGDIFIDQSKEQGGAKLTAAGAQYEVVLAGGADIGGQTLSQKLFAPAIPTITTSVVDGNLVVKWDTTDETRDVFFFVLPANPGPESLDCHVEDDGVFVVDRAALEKWVGTSGLVQIVVQGRHYVELGGRRVTLLGWSNNAELFEL